MFTLQQTVSGERETSNHTGGAIAPVAANGNGHSHIPHNRNEIRIETAQSALVLSVGDDSRLYQRHYGAKGSELQRAPDRQSEYYPQYGDGYILEPALRAQHADGNTSTDLRLVGSEVVGIDENVTLTSLRLSDPVYPITVTLRFKAYRREDIIEAWTETQHHEDGTVTLSNFASSSFLFDPADFWLTQFYGDWNDEMNIAEEKLGLGIKVLDSKFGVRTTQFRNCSFLLSTDGPAKENTGEVFGAALAWSGAFQMAFEMDVKRRLRTLCGMNPFGSEYHLKPGETYMTPAMIWGWSGSGKGTLSRNFHRWARQYGVRNGDRTRGVLLNNWEATYFKFDEEKIVSLFAGAKSLGMDLFLLDDGWFGNKHARNDDTQGLGDWDVNVTKLPQGIGYLADQAARQGIRFGIWIEPEMVNPTSELYETHPDWVIKQPGRSEELQRNQMVLDLTRPEVREFVFKTVDDLLTQNPGISYVKWDCNRYVTQPGSSYLAPGEQSHLWYRYISALYDVMGRVRSRHPDVELMQCAGGGGRVDYGSLRFGHEFWPSDNTNPVSRVYIQWGYSQLFPTIATACHVTSSGHMPMKFAFDVAMSGRLGMDMDVDQLSACDRRFATEAIATYKTISDIVQLGEQYRLESPFEGPRATLLYVSDDRRRAVLFGYQMKDGTTANVVLQGLDPDRRYTVREINLPQGVNSRLAAGPLSACGESLMCEGLALPLSSQYESAVIAITADA